MQNARSIQGIVVLTVGIFLSLWLGMALVTDQFDTILKVGGGALLLIGALMGRRIWLLFIFFTSMNVVLYRWTGTVELGQFLLIGFSAALFLMRRLHYQVRFGELEIWVVLIIASIVQAYFRNPVGLSIFGAGNVGGRPYFAMALWCASAAILSSIIVPPGELKWALRLSIIGSFMGIPLQAARYGSMSGNVGDSGVNLEGGTRIMTFSTLSATIARWVSCYISPLKACIKPQWAVVLLFSLWLAAASGFRNSVANVGFIYIVAICYHGGIKSFLASSIMGVLALALLAMINLNFPLPGNLQRALSPLPGTWEEQYRQAGVGSTEWRMEMWEEALTSEKWIHNKILGDGIGMTAEELNRMVNLESLLEGGLSGLSNQQEQMLITGSYHSGPVHSIRMTGYVGLAILLLAMIRTAIYAHRQIMRCKGTEWAPVAIFFCIPLISQPFFFALVFGEYPSAVAQTIVGMAMIRLLERNIPLPAYVVHRNRNHIPLVLKSRISEVQNTRSA